MDAGSTMTAAMVFEILAEPHPRDERKKRCIEYGNRLVGERLKADQLIRRVLDGSRDAVGVFRARNEECIRVRHLRAKPCDGIRWLGFSVGIEQRQLPKPLEHRDRDLQQRQAWRLLAATPS